MSEIVHPRVEQSSTHLVRIADKLNGTIYDLLLSETMKWHGMTCRLLTESSYTIPVDCHMTLYREYFLTHRTSSFLYFPFQTYCSAIHRVRIDSLRACNYLFHKNNDDNNKQTNNTNRQDTRGSVGRCRFENGR
jgi:hypothetical protein